MPSCAAPDCFDRLEKGKGSKNNKVFWFPTEPGRRQKWIAILIAQGKNDNWKPNKSSYLCKAHFEPQQHKWNAIPTLFPQSDRCSNKKRQTVQLRDTSENDDHSYCGKVYVKTKQIVSPCPDVDENVDLPVAVQSNSPNTECFTHLHELSNPEQHTANVSEQSSIETALPDIQSNQNNLEEVNVQEELNSTLEPEQSSLKTSNGTAVTALINVQEMSNSTSESLQEARSTSSSQINNKIRELERKLQKSERQLHLSRKSNANLRLILWRERKQRVDESKKKFGNFLQLDQVKRLKNGGNLRGSRWSEITIKNALKLYVSCGRAGYEELLRQNYPLPSLRTLRRETKSSSKPDNLEEVFSTCNVTPQEKFDFQQTLDILLEYGQT